MLVVMCAKVICPNMVMWGDLPLQGLGLIHEVHVCWVCAYTHVGVWDCTLFSSVCAFCVCTHVPFSVCLTSCMSLCASLLYVYHSLVYSTMGCIGYNHIALHMYTDNIIQNMPNVPVLLNQHPSPSQPFRLYSHV